MILSSKQSVPTVIIRSREELEEFIGDVGEQLEINGKMPYSLYENDFMTVADKCTDEFFSEKSLSVSYVWEGSGSTTHSVESIWRDGDKLDIHIEKHMPEVGTCDMAHQYGAAERIYIRR